MHPPKWLVETGLQFPAAELARDGNPMHELGLHTPKGVESVPRVQVIDKLAFNVYPLLHCGVQVLPCAMVAAGQLLV